jgi:hypothetical protein
MLPGGRLGEGVAVALAVRALGYLLSWTRAQAAAAAILTPSQVLAALASLLLLYLALALFRRVRSGLAFRPCGYFGSQFGSRPVAVRTIRTTQAI